MKIHDDSRTAIDNYCSHFKAKACLCSICDGRSMDLLLAITELEEGVAQLTKARNQCWQMQWEAVATKAENDRLKASADLWSRRYNDAMTSGEAYTTGYENGRYDGEAEGYDQGVADGEHYADGQKAAR